MSNTCKHYFVSGNVQGVWFRANTKKEADVKGVTGWVRNLPDGRVEVMMCGTSEQIAAMEAWLQHGPERARVDQLESETVDFREYQDFIVL